MHTVENNTQSLFAAQALEAPEALAAALAPHAAPGHFDELRGRSQAAPPLQAQSQSQNQNQASLRRVGPTGADAC